MKRRSGECAARAVLLALAIALLPTAAVGSDWPQLLGPNRDGVIPGKAIEAWPASGPKVAWTREVGAGFAGPAVAGQRVLVFHRIGGQEVLDALDAATGKSLWRSQTPTRYRDDFGFDEGPRAVPVVAGDRVITVGAEGALTAWRLADGVRLWQRDTRADFSVRKGFFGVATSPLVAEGVVLMNVGGQQAGIVGFDLESGKTIWQSTSDEQSYSSPTIASIAGRPSALFFTREGLVAVAPSSGEVVARFAHKTRIRSSVNAATPVVVGQRVFLSAEYGVGAVLLNLPTERGAEPEPVWQSRRALNNHYATSVHHEGVLYGFHGRQESGAALRAVALDSGEVLWSEERYGAGSILLTGDRLLVLSEEGELTLALASPEQFRPLARARILDGVVRAYPAVANGRLFARGPRALVALELTPLERGG